MSEIRNNPPDSVVEFDELDMYRTLYDDITDNKVLLQYHDRHSLGELAVMMCEINRLRVEIRRDGESMEVQGDRHIVTKKNPARDALEKIRPQCHKLMKEFKMTPQSRGKQVGEFNKKKADDGFDEV
jgi:P27 family predicted phage terminase small subunit